MLGLIIYLLIVGAVAGYLARLLVPGRDDIGFVRTVALGIAGSFIGGFLGYLIFDKDFDEGGLQASGIIGSLIGAVIALLIYRKVAGGTAPPATPAEAGEGRERRQAERRDRRERQGGQ